MPSLSSYLATDLTLILPSISTDQQEALPTKYSWLTAHLDQLGALTRRIPLNEIDAATHEDLLAIIQFGVTKDVLLSPSHGRRTNAEIPIYRVRGGYTLQGHYTDYEATKHYTHYQAKLHQASKHSHTAPRPTARSNHTANIHQALPTLTVVPPLLLLRTPLLLLLGLLPSNGILDPRLVRLLGRLLELFDAVRRAAGGRVGASARSPTSSLLIPLNYSLALVTLRTPMLLVSELQHLALVVQAHHARPVRVGVRRVVETGQLGVGELVGVLGGGVSDELRLGKGQRLSAEQRPYGERRRTGSGSWSESSESSSSGISSFMVRR